MEIGKKLKQLRIKNGLTLEELASRSELSKGFLSQLENDLTSPSIATLSDLVEALGTDLSAFFKQEKEEQIVFKSDDYFIDENEDHTIHWIVPNAQKNEMEPIMLELKAGGVSNTIEPHEGEEFGYVLSGSIQIILGRRIVRAKKGESFYFKPDKQHYIKANEKNGAVIIWVSSPPSF